MKYSVRFLKAAAVGLAKLRKSDPAAYRKALKLVDAIAEDPRRGIGKPEPLKGGDGVTWSRRVTGRDRVVYDIYEEVVEVCVIEVGGHYGDK